MHIAAVVRAVFGTGERTHAAPLLYVPKNDQPYALIRGDRFRPLAAHTNTSAASTLAHTTLRDLISNLTTDHWRSLMGPSIAVTARNALPRIKQYTFHDSC